MRWPLSAWADTQTCNNNTIARIESEVPLTATNIRFFIIFLVILYFSQSNAIPADEWHNHRALF
jgi:hypothetical protein